MKIEEKNNRRHPVSPEEEIGVGSFRAGVYLFWRDYRVPISQELFSYKTYRMFFKIQEKQQFKKKKDKI